ncbi:MAG TPA: Uma2 family endonuclease, partial [Allocoleopsis sp.]
EIQRLKLPYLLDQNSIVKPIDSDDSGYKPDIMIIDKDKLNNEPMWQKRSTIIKGKTIPLIIEVVSTNWANDYAMKLEEYEKLGISEYWIVDYLGLGGIRYIGNPKQPTISIYNLIDGEYKVKLFRENDTLESLVLTQLNLTVKEIIM